jgi:EmrB/QacA subfamily drug resistance transporter
LRTNHRGILVATILGSSLAFIDSTLVNVILPKMQSDFGADLSSAQWIIQSYGLFLSTFLLLGGSLGDRYGRKRLFQFGLFLFLSASVGCALSPTFAFLLIARSLQGLGAAMLTPGSLAIINATFPKESRAKAIGVWSGFSAISAAIGPAFGGWISDTVGWRWSFLINVPLGAIAIVVASRSIPDDCGEKKSAHLDYFGTLLSTIGIGSLVFSLTEKSLIGFLGGVFFLIAFLLFESKTPHPILPLNIFKSRLFSLTNALTFIFYAALSGSFFNLSLHLINADSYSSAEAGLATLPFVILLSSLSRWTGGLLDKLGAKLMLTAGPLITGLGFGLFALLTAPGKSYWVSYFPCMVVAGFGMAFTVAPLTTAVLGSLDDAQSGLASGVNNTAARTAGLFGVSLVTLALVHDLSFHLICLGIAGLCAVSAIFGFAIVTD